MSRQLNISATTLVVSKNVMTHLATTVVPITTVFWSTAYDSILRLYKRFALVL